MVLERLGWRIHRVWSTDWFRNPERELRRVVGAIEAAAARGETTPIPVASAIPTTIERHDDEEPAASPTGVPPYVIAEPVVRTGGLELHAVPGERIAGWVVEVVSVEGPVHIDDVMRRIADGAGVSRIGSRIRSAFEDAIVQASLAGKIEQRGAFLWPAGMTEPPLRDRSALANGRSLDVIAPEEIALAIRTAVANAYGMEQAQIAATACRLLGFPRLTEEMRATVDPLIDDLLASGHLMRKGEHLTVADA